MRAFELDQRPDGAAECAEADMIKSTLIQLRARYTALLEDLSRGERVLWIGSGVSRDQVPPVEALIRMVLEFLRDTLVPDDPTDPHLLALKEIVTAYLPAEIANLSAAPSAWAVPTDLSALVNSYSSILGTDVGVEEPDYLLWEAVNVRETYGGPALVPGPEHWLIAILVHEGAMEEAVTTNWDGLIERAVRDSSMPLQPAMVSVLVSSESFREERSRFKLYKAHGCAVLARQDPANRRFLVAKDYDINGWQHNPDFRAMVSKLKDLARNREALVLGSSVQDHNLLGRIAEATQELTWHWDPDDPAFLFAEPSISNTQRLALEFVYRGEYTANREAIRAGSAIGWFSGPVLAALAVHVVFEKWRVGLAHALGFAGSGDVAAGLVQGVDAIEDLVLTLAGPSPDRTVELLRGWHSALVQRFFQPEDELQDHQYRAVYDRPVQAGHDAQFRLLNLPELGVVLGLLGLGQQRRSWTMSLSADAAIGAGVIELTPLRPGSGGAIKVVITRDWSETNQLMASQLWAGDSGVLLAIQAKGDPVAAFPRSPLGGLGSGRRRPDDQERRVTHLSVLEAVSTDTETLITAFESAVWT